MAAFKSEGYTVFRDGDPGVPDIAAEKKRGRSSGTSSRSAMSGRFVSHHARAKIGRVLRRKRRR